LENLNSLLTFIFEIMTLPIEEANDYKNFRQFKEKEMTDTAFKKRREKTHKDFADIYIQKAALMGFPIEFIDDIILLNGRFCAFGLTAAKPNAQNHSLRSISQKLKQINKIEHNVAAVLTVDKL
jgi:hypothetical protein